MDVSGEGPDVLLLHGTGGNGQTWRHLVPELARGCRVLVPDLPGHGDSLAPGGYSPAAMSRALRTALEELGAAPQLIIGHSAGAALGAWMMLLDGLPARGLVGVAPAMLGFPGVRRMAFSALAKVLAANPVVPHVIAWRARDRRAVARLMAGVGSDLEASDVDRYSTLLGRPRHVHGVLRMMSQWDLGPLEGCLAQLRGRILLVAGGRDQAVPDAEIRRLQSRIPCVPRVDVPNAGHLLQEEQPALLLKAVEPWARGLGVSL